MYMVSDQAVEMEDSNVFAESDSRKLLKIRVSNDEKDIVPNVLAESKKGLEFDPSWFVVNVGVGNMPDTRYNVLKHAEFPVCNR